MPTSVITGVTGQDGAYLAQQLLERGHKVFGAFRRTSSVNFWRLEELGVHDHPNLKLVEFDLIDTGACLRLLDKPKPDYVYNLAAQSFVGVSFQQPIATAQMTGIGPLHLLEAIRQVNDKIKFYQASSSEHYGRVRAVPQNEDTPFHPRSPYAVAKAIRPLDYGELPGIVRHLRQQRHFVQSRVAVARPGVCDTKDHECRGAHSSRQARLAGNR